jgi:hypothetical protein
MDASWNQPRPLFTMRGLLDPACLLGLGHLGLPLLSLFLLERLLPLLSNSGRGRGEGP